MESQRTSVPFVPGWERLESSELGTRVRSLLEPPQNRSHEQAPGGGGHHIAFQLWVCALNFSPSGTFQSHKSCLGYLFPHPGPL